MRLWHYKLIPFLPKSQLLAQWRELNLIFKREYEIRGKRVNHILINYIYEYPFVNLLSYSTMIMWEMRKRGFKVNKKNYSDFYGMLYADDEFPEAVEHPFKNHHNYRYLQQCFYNLQEKYDRGQKDFSKEQYDKLFEFFILETFEKGGYKEENNYG